MQKQHRAEAAREGALSFSLGAERIGLLALRFRWVVLSAVIVISALAALGIRQLKLDNSLTELFRADTPEFRQYERLSSRFPSSEYDVLVVVEGPTLLDRTSVDALRNAVIELQFVDGIRGLISMFSARASPEPGKLPPPLFPATLPEGAAYDQLITDVRANRILDGKAALHRWPAYPDCRRARPRYRPEQPASKHDPRHRRHRRHPARRDRPQRAACRRAGDAAGNPQRRSARPHHL